MTEMMGENVFHTLHSFSATAHPWNWGTETPLRTI